MKKSGPLLLIMLILLGGLAYKAKKDRQAYYNTGCLNGILQTCSLTNSDCSLDFVNASWKACSDVMKDK